MKKLYIIGAGSVGGHIAWNLRSYTKDFNLIGFFDDDPKKIGKEQFGYKVVGPVKEVLNLEEAAIVIGIAFPKVKKNIIDKVSSNSTLCYPTFVHERAWISSDVKVGRGVVIYPGTTINFGSNIGDFVVLNVNCSLGHHTKIGSFSSLAPGVNTGGYTRVGKYVDVGIGASTIQNIQIGDSSVIGGQSMIIEDVLDGKTVAGVPGKELSALKNNLK